MNKGRLLFPVALVVILLELICVRVFAQEPLNLGSASLPSGLKWKAKDVGQDPSEAPAQPNFDDSGWTVVEVPADLTPDVVGENTNFWYRLTGLKIPSNWPRDRYLILYNFNVDDSDRTYFNGVLIGTTNGWNVERKYIIPPSLVNWEGTNTIAIWGTQGTGGSGISQNEPILEPGPADKAVITIQATDAQGKGIAGIPITIKIGDTVMEELSDVSTLVLTDLPSGTGTIEAISQPWVGTVKPEGPQPITLKGGQLLEIKYSVEPYIYRVVKADKPIKIDGVISEDEWAGAMVMVVDQPRQLRAVGGQVTPDDCSAVARWKWDENYIYAAIEVTDDVPRINSHTDPSDGNLWQGDSVETYIQLDPFDPKRRLYRADRNFQWTIGVGDPPQWKIFQNAGQPTDYTIASGQIPDWREGPHLAVVERKTPKPGYIVEARFPWKGLPNVNPNLIPPKEGTEGGIGMAVNDTDTPDSTTRENQIMWNGYDDLWTNASHFTRALWAGPPVTVVYGDLNGDGRVAVQDAIVSLRISVGIVTPTDAQKKAGDVNGDGKLNLTDTLLILQRAVGKITKFPVEG